MKFWRKLHKWLGLIVVAQVLIWTCTGSLISFINAEDATGTSTRRAPPPEKTLGELNKQQAFATLPAGSATTRSIELFALLSRPYYRLVSGSDVIVIDAWSGDRARISADLARKIAQQSYTGDAQPDSIERLSAGAIEVASARGPLWRVNFADALHTRVYVSGSDGSVIAHRNKRSELLDFLLMLHFMDYLQTDNFNNPQIIVFGFGTLWLAISGGFLLITRFSHKDFRSLFR